MKKISLLIALISILFAACDDGDITTSDVVYTQTGRTLNLSVDILGVNSNNWPDGCNVVVAGFSDSEYADISKNILSNGNIDVQLTGIGTSVKKIEICVINRLRKRIATFYEYDCSDTTENQIDINAGAINVSSRYSAVQSAVFNQKCITCHGKSTFASAGLYLTDSLSYNALVNKYSTKDTTALLVLPNNADLSFLLKVVNGNADSLLRHPHKGIIPDYENWRLNLIKDWINFGAEE